MVKEIGTWFRRVLNAIRSVCAAPVRAVQPITPEITLSIYPYGQRDKQESYLQAWKELSELPAGRAVIRRIHQYYAESIQAICPVELARQVESRALWSAKQDGRREVLEMLMLHAVKNTELLKFQETTKLPPIGG